MKCDKLNRYSLDVDYEEQAIAVPNDDGEYMLSSDVEEVIDEKDKVISNKDNEIKKLKQSISKLLKIDTEKVLNEVMQKTIIYGEGFIPVEQAMKLISELNQQKYKLCLVMANEWRNYAAFCGMQSHCHNHRGFGKTAEKWNWKECHAWKCVHRYKELAEKFKEKK